MGVSMSTLAGWAVVLSITGAIAYTERQRRAAKRAAKASAVRGKHERQNPVARKEIKENKPKRQRIEDTQRDSYASKLKAQAPVSSYQAHSSDDDVDNREFARQLSSVKEGTKFNAKAKDDTRQKSVKQSRAQEIPEPAGGKVSAPSSTAGIDADDDQSSTASPVLGAVTAGISDMLEKATPGPSVLRLTDTEEKKANQKKAKAPEPALTKKQRQRQKKNEERKEERDETEKERKALMEQQRRGARLAREADESRRAAPQPASGAWTGNGVNGTTNGQANTNGYLPVQPLDTFDANAVKRNAPTQASDDWKQSLPSEEEQMQMIHDEEAWNTVKPKSRKGKKKEATDESNDEAAAIPQPSVPAPQPVKKPQNTANNSRPTKAFTQKSSFAALSNDNPTEDQEEEWDV